MKIVADNLDKDCAEMLGAISGQVGLILSDIRSVWTKYYDEGSIDGNLAGIIQSAIGFCHIRICAFSEEMNRLEKRSPVAYNVILEKCDWRINKIKDADFIKFRHIALAHPFRDGKQKYNSILKSGILSKLKIPTTISEYEGLGGDLSYIVECIQNYETTNSSH